MGRLDYLKWYDPGPIYYGIPKRAIRSKLRYYEYPVKLKELAKILGQTKFATYPIKVRILCYYLRWNRPTMTEEKFNNMVQERSYYIWKNKGFVNCFGQYYQVCFCTHPGLCQSTFCKNK